MSDPSPPEEQRVAPEPRRRRWRRWVALVGVLVLVSAPWWGRRLLSRMDFFRVRVVHVHGARYAKERELVSLLGLDSTTSLFVNLDSLARRVRAHPQVESLRVSRGLPGTLHLTIVERLPVALTPVEGTLAAIDASGRRLPLDPARVPIDLPVVSRRDPPVYRLLEDLRTAEPALFARISEVRRSGPDEIVVQLNTVPVRAMVDITTDRFLEIAPVEADLARRGARAAEIDLRFKNQVIARLP